MFTARAGEFTEFNSSLSCENVRYSRHAGSLPRMQRKSSGAPGLCRIPFADGAHFIGAEDRPFKCDVTGVLGVAVLLNYMKNKD